MVLVEGVFCYDVNWNWWYVDFLCWDFIYGVGILFGYWILLMIYVIIYGGWIFVECDVYVIEL